MSKLKGKQLRFCEEYLIDLNATQAAIRAGYSKKTAGSIGQENLTKPEIVEFIQDLQRKRSERTGISADRVLAEVANIAFSNMRDFAEFGADGIRFKDSENVTDEQMKLVSELSQEVKEFKGVKTTSVKFKLYPKDAALYNLMRHLGLFEKDNKQQNNVITVIVED